MSYEEDGYQATNVALTVMIGLPDLRASALGEAPEFLTFSSQYLHSLSR